MSGPPKLHADELSTDAGIARRLIASQFPQWADLPMRAAGFGGTDNALYRLGEEMVVRLPRRPDAAAQVEKEQLWLPRLAPRLPLAVPEPLGRGAPSDDYPGPWSVCRWLDGEDATTAPLGDPARLAVDLAGFLAALWAIDAADGPRPGRHNAGRGAALARRDEATRTAIAASDGLIDAGAAARAWETDLAAPAWDGPPTWVHGDLLAGNLLFAGGRLSAVIDFGCLGVGDPACDLLTAWSLFEPEARDLYRAALAVDGATWARGRGWALSVAAIQLPYYQRTQPVMAANARRAIEAVLAEHARAL